MQLIPIQLVTGTTISQALNEYMYNAHTFKPIVYVFHGAEYSVKIKYIITLNLIIFKIYNIILLSM